MRVLSFDLLVQSLISVLLLYPNRENYVFLQVGFQHLAYEKREDIASYGLESLLGKSNTDINKCFPFNAFLMVADGVFSNRTLKKGRKRRTCSTTSALLKSFIFEDNG